MTKIDVVALNGSLREKSLNAYVLRLAADLMPVGMTLELLDWRDVPILNADDIPKGYPPSVLRIRDRIAHADAVLIGSPEFNYSIPGGLKNVLDWVSRGDDQPFARKPVSLITVSPGPVGGSRVQYELRKVLQFMDAHVMNRPEVFVTAALQKFDADGNCTDETTKEFVRVQMAAFHTWIAHAKAARPH